MAMSSWQENRPTTPKPVGGKARRWLSAIIEGKSFCEIAASEGVSKRRIQDVANLALLAPDVLDGIAAGELN